MRGKESQEEWIAEKKMYEGIYASRTGRTTKIIDITGDDLGYTGKDGDIHLKKDHPVVMKDMSNSEKIAFRAGVFCHEMLHQIFTDFGYLEKVVTNQKNPKERQVISLFCNLIEDPAIEHQAPEVVGGSLLKSLNFSIRTIYEQSPEITDKENPFSELCNALIQFGDMGIIKGRFSEETLPYFKKIAPEFYAAILNHSSKERMDAAVGWAEYTRPLWESKTEEELQKDADKILQNASSQMNGEGEQNESSEGEPQTGEGEPNEKGSGEGDKREETLKRLLAGEDISSTSEEANKQASESLPVTPADLQQLEQEIWDSMDPYDKEMVNNNPISEIPEIHMPEYNGTKCDNIPADHVGKRAEYEEILAPLRKDIRILTRSLRNIFMNDIDEELRATSGKYNILRGIKGNTVKVFDKKKERKNIDDLAVMILVDESGSMEGERIKNARKATTLLAETFANLKVPCSIIGFTADETVDITHRHYVSWKASAVERTSIASMRARANNFDGYSIRYAGRIAQKRNAEHKIMFVISDGMPNCRNYRTKQAGIKDTADAIREMGRFMTVMGIGIGGKNEAYSRMYGGSFVNTAPETLAVELAQQLKRILKKTA